MNKIILTFCTCLFLFTLATVESCKPGDSTSSMNSEADYSQPADSIRKKDVEVQVENINAKLRTATLKRIPYPAEGSLDTLDYWELNNKPIRISLRVMRGDMELWPTFFVQDDQLILVRYRTWSKAPPMPWAEENMIYLRDGRIFYCDERRSDLPDNSIPANVRMIPFNMSAKSFTELENKYKADWQKIKEVLSLQVN